MANIKIAQLTNQTTISDTDLVIVETSTSTNKMTVGNLKSLLGINEGGVVESGSNANGNYIKYSDGTMICHGRIKSDTGLNTQDGVFYKGELVTIPYPVKFVGNTPSVTVTMDRTDRMTTVRVASVGLSNILAEGYAYNSPVGSGYSYYFTYIAIGRWK